LVKCVVESATKSHCGLINALDFHKKKYVRAKDQAVWSLELFRLFKTRGNKRKS
jgi:hypothetical protein